MADWQNTLKNLGKTARDTAEAERAAEKIRAAEAARRKAEAMTFAAAVGKVTPLKSSRRHSRPIDTTPVYPRRQTEERDNSGDIFVAESDGSESAPPRQYAAGGGGQNDIKKLLSGKLEIVSTLDLHGYSQEEAQTVLNEFIDYVQRRGVCGEIIHGSGLGSRGFVPKLKNLVRRWLIAHPQVLAYTEPDARNDGTVLILLKRKRRTGEI